MGFRHCWAHVCQTEYGAPAGFKGKIISGESLVEGSVVSIRVHNFSPTLKNRHLYESSLHSIIHINVPINFISPTPSTISHSLHSSYLTVGESVAINIWVFFPKIHHLISHKHINTKTFHQSITTYSSLLLDDMMVGLYCNTTFELPLKYGCWDFWMALERERPQAYGCLTCCSSHKLIPANRKSNIWDFFNSSVLPW